MSRFPGGAVMGLAVASLGLFGVGLLFYFYGKPDQAAVINGFAMGASSIALFARVGGGIYTKTADVGADLVGKVEAGIPEDDPRNPAVIADHVGDNVGDVAGMGADIFESYVGSIIATIAIAATAGGAALSALGGDSVMVRIAAMQYPLVVVMIGLLASMIGVGSIRILQSLSPDAALRYATYISAVLMLVGAYFAAEYLGLARGCVLGDSLWLSRGHCDCADDGVLYGRRTCQAHCPFFGDGVGDQYDCGSGGGDGEYDVADFGDLCCDCRVRFTLRGCTVLALPPWVCYRLWALRWRWMLMVRLRIMRAVFPRWRIWGRRRARLRMSWIRSGNTTAAIGKGFAIGSAALTALALFSAYSAAVGIESINLTKPLVVIGLFLGGGVPFCVAALTMTSVGNAAFKMVEEVRRQFREIPGLMEGTGKPDTRRCVDISSVAALREMVVPGLVAVLTPVLVGFFLGGRGAGRYAGGGDGVGCVAGADDGE